MPLVIEPAVAVMDVGVRVPQLLVVAEQVVVAPAIDREAASMSPTTSCETEMSNVVWVVVPAVTVGEAEFGSETETIVVFVELPPPLDITRLFGAVSQAPIKAHMVIAHKKIGRWRFTKTESRLITHPHDDDAVRISGCYRSAPTLTHRSGKRAQSRLSRSEASMHRTLFES